MWGHVAISQVRQALGDTEGALGAARQSRRGWPGAPEPTTRSWMVAVWKTRLYLPDGEISRPPPPNKSGRRAWAKSGSLLARFGAHHPGTVADRQTSPAKRCVFWLQLQRDRAADGGQDDRDTGAAGDGPTCKRQERGSKQQEPWLKPSPWPNRRVTSVPSSTRGQSMAELLSGILEAQRYRTLVLFRPCPVAFAQETPGGA